MVVLLFFYNNARRFKCTGAGLFFACCLPGGSYADDGGWFPPDGVICNIGNPTVNLGSIEGSLTKPVVVAGNFQGTCTSTAYRVQDGGNRRVAEGAFCLTIEPQGTAADGRYHPRYLYNAQNPGYRIPFNFYHPGQENAVPIGNEVQGWPLWNRGQAPYSSNITGPVVVPLDWGFTAKLDMPERAVPPGVYSNTFRVITYGGARRRGDYPEMKQPGACKPFLSKRVNLFTVTTTVKESCNINIEEHINLGRHSRLEYTITGAGAITVRCSDKTKFQVGMSEGLNSSSPRQRFLKIENGGANMIHYNIFHDKAGNRLWTDEWNTPNVLHGTGTGSTQYYKVYAIVPPQALQPYGAYSDTVRVELKMD